jgi:2-polyprenyl-6-methoxyphenol hydroxylase-like FAD-dependent oxidoreductase
MGWTRPTRPSIAFCEKVFADNLQGAKLMTNARHLRGSAWLNFQRVKCEQWSHFNGRSHVVLMGDAVHTAHFAIGSGTKLAIEDAIELTRQFKELGDSPQHIPAGAGALPGSAQRGGAEAAERRLERHGMVRGVRRALLRHAGPRPSSCTPC